jgi:hypothetical protein
MCYLHGRTEKRTFRDLGSRATDPAGVIGVTPFVGTPGDRIEHFPMAHVQPEW